MPSAAEEGCSLVFFHGFGDSARGFVGQLPSLLGMPSTRYVLPTARLQGGMRSWFAGMGPGGADDSIRYAHHLFRQELERGVPGDRLFVGGFSQGGSVAVRAALSFGDAALGGCVAASTFLGEGPPQVAEVNRRLPVLCCHGLADSAVPARSGEALVSALRALGAPTDWRTYAGMGHAYCAEEAADVRRWLQRRTLLAGGGAGLARLSAREIKALLLEAGVSTLGCLEKSDFLERARQLL